MQRFTGQDASFLYMETPSVHMHTLKVAIVDLPAKIPDNDLFELVRIAMESKLHLVPRLRLRPVEVPGGIHHPMWVNDPNFNIGRHLFRTKIAEPGGPRQMDEAIAGIAPAFEFVDATIKGKPVGSTAVTGGAPIPRSASSAKG